jgi:hypothetical protein
MSRSCAHCVLNPLDFFTIWLLPHHCLAGRGVLKRAVIVFIECRTQWAYFGRTFLLHQVPAGQRAIPLRVQVPRGRVTGARAARHLPRQDVESVACAIMRCALLGRNARYYRFQSEGKPVKFRKEATCRLRWSRSFRLCMLIKKRIRAARFKRYRLGTDRSNIPSCKDTKGNFGRQGGSYVDRLSSWLTSSRESRKIRF